jgi:two-component system KDP operon response regulator KdpE
MQHDDVHTLVVSQQHNWLSLIYTHLWQNGFAPLTIAPTGANALEMLRQLSPRLVLVDYSLPDCGALKLCADLLQAQPTVKLVLVTNSDVEPSVAALHAGVSACIHRDSPPTVWSGLLAHVLNGGIAFSHRIVEAVMPEEKTQHKHQPLISVGILQIDLSQQMVVYAGRRVALTRREFSVLTCLARNTDRVVTFDQLLNEAWGYDASDGTPAQVRLYVARLRRKLFEDAQLPGFILTERGIGYRLHSELLHAINIPDLRLHSVHNIQAM